MMRFLEQVSMAVVASAMVVAVGCQDPVAVARTTAAEEHRGHAERALAEGEYARALAAAEQAALYDPFTPQHQDLVNRVKLSAIAEATRPIRVEDGESLAYIAEAMAGRDAQHVHVYQTALGRLRFLLGQNELAKEALDAALAAKPSYWAASQAMAVYLEGQGDLTGAVEHIRASFSANTEHLGLQAQLGNLLVRSGQVAEG
ncbi:MAG: hypothetical protein CL902_02490, partial [Dehalococcoidia bacterium]|nr:hypothetical protein [Dehalococcoidia bacterium]